MAFTKIAVINIAGASVGAVATIAFALAGFSYMSFAWSWLLAGVVTAVTSIIIYPQPWIFRPSLKNWRGMVRFGAYNGASVMLYSMYDTLTYMSFGWVASAHAAAIFNRGMMLCQLPGKLILSGAVTVVLPAFSQHYREGRSLKAPYLHTVALITGLHWPALLVLSVLADPVVKTLFGSQWHDVVPLVRIIAIASLFTFNFQINYQAMVAMGAMRESFLRALITYPLSTVVMVVAIWKGGLEAAAWSMMFIVPFQAFIAISFIKRRLLLSFAEIGMVLWKSAVVAVMAAIGPLSVVAGTDWNWHLSLPLTALAVVFAALGWGAGLAMTKHPLLGELTEPMSFLRMKLSTRFGAARFSQ
jgi:O-antigen/teichoic acid export membrane protein